jgi:hypothetical protein
MTITVGLFTTAIGSIGALYARSRRLFDGESAA